MAKNMTVFLTIAMSFLFAGAVVQSPKATNRAISPEVATGIGGSFGILMYAVTFFLTMACVPRQSEGVRQVVDMPWPLYVALPTALAFVPLLVLGLTVPKRKWSSFFIIGFNLAIAASTCVGSDLLRRDYIGKF